MYFITFVVSIPLVLVLLLKNPEIQIVVTKSAAAFLSRHVGTEVKIGSVSFTWRAGFLLEDLLVKDNKGTDMIAVKKLETRLGVINRKEKIITLGKLNIEGLDFVLRKYKLENMLNLDDFLQHFVSGLVDTTIVADSTKPWILEFKSLQIRQSHFIYEDQDYKIPGPGIDFSDIELNNLDIDIENLSVNDDTISGNVENISFVEKSGFVLKEFCGNIQFDPKSIAAENLMAITNNSSLDLDLVFNFDSFDDFNDFINKVSFDTKIRNTTLEMSDIGYFAPIMFTMTDLINIEGNFKGTVANIKGNEFTAAFGDNTRFEGTVRMNGLPDITETFIHANIVSFTTSDADLRNFALPGDSSTFLLIPDVLAKMGLISVSGKFTGFYNDFVSRARFETSLGRLNTDITLVRTGDKRELSYSGKLDGSNLDVGKLFNLTSTLGKASFSVNVDGAGVKLSTLDFTMEGSVSSIGINGYSYENVVVDGALSKQVFNGNLSVADENLDFAFTGMVDFNKETPVFNFYSKISNADLFKLNLSTRDSTMKLSTVLHFNFSGNTLDELDGKIQIDSTFYVENSRKYQLEALTLESFHEPDGQKYLSLHSDFVDAEFVGKFKFSSLLASVKRFVGNYSKVVAAVFPPDDLGEERQEISFAVSLKETSQLTDLFMPQLKVAKNSRIEGLFDTKSKNLNIEGFSDLVEVSGVDFQNCRIEANSGDTDFDFSVFSKHLMFADANQNDSLGIGIDSLLLETSLRTDSVFYRLRWNDLSNTAANTADFQGFLQLQSMYKINSRLSNVNLLVDGNNWKVKPENLLVADTTGIYFKDFVFYSDSSKFSVAGGVSQNSADSLKLGFHDLDISHLDLLIPGTDIDINGYLNGNATFVNLYSNPNFLIDIKVNDLFFNGQDFGILRLNTNWDDNSGSLGVNLGIIDQGNIGSSEILTITGNYMPSDLNQNFNFDVKLNNLSTDVFNPFVSEFVEISQESLASGKLKFTGTNEKPVAIGRINLTRTQVLVKYLNVYYSAGGSVEIGENFINVNELNVFDTKGQSATCTGEISHYYFKDFAFDIQVKHENFSALNTTSKDNELFYGTAVASGTLDIRGPLDDIRMDIKARTEKGTTIIIPISSTISVNENDFIIFINNSDTTISIDHSYNLNLKGLTLNLDIEVTPDANIQLFLPYNMGNIKGNGSGDLRLGINPQGDFTMTGDYVISEGQFFFTLEKLIGREFEIVEGSKIVWTGSPYDATVKIKAIYPVKTTLNGLRLQTDSTSVYETRVQVKCIIELQNELFNPDIKFSIDFANVAEDVKQIIYASLDTTDQSVMSQQMLSLLVLGSFSYASNSANIESTGFKLLSKQLSGWLSKISKDFDIGINYQPGSNITQEELEVALQTQLFDDRLSIDGNFGVRGTTTTQNTSSVVGDILVEYKITNDGRFRVRAFNRTNDISFLEDNAPYTQGVGIFYRKEFEKFGKLLKSEKKQKRKEQRKKSKEEKAILQESAIREDDE